MDTFAYATVIFVDGFTVEVGDYLYGGEMGDLNVRLDGEWVHIQPESGDGADSFPASAIKCIAWNEYPAKTTEAS